MIKFIARENRVLATWLCHTWKVTKQRTRLLIRWIRGHSGDVVNRNADRLQHRWWRRYPLLGGCRLCVERRCEKDHLRRKIL